ncbi:protein TIC 20-I, chloroplastic-like [Chenopodium quinoa]|uniref:Protein TIC 20 n=1 Tax=Chenopodium quinoa TaxID=63459 RepID=A0A803M6Y6_CHEQI|nr:protein TIC 20-I, chloroplastic-like [Chenopodium quinoa]XP_021746515.1 protein TIC 20-I, chloroplastic-like [Chenopodium quinoa]XP_021746516.1 protein TIC 20-I, chloroplastic-like [Chenopodium quinoa]
MIINGCSMNFRPYKPISCNASRPRPAPLPAKAALTNVRALCRPTEALKLNHPTGFSLSSHLSASSTPLLGGEHGGLSHTIPLLPKRRGHSMVPRAAKDVPYSFRFPQMMKKPRWWWRTLACLPYLMPLHETWMYAETAYHLHPFLEDLEFLTYPFLRSIGRLPPWFFMAYFFVAYLGIVRRKEWPHFFRFHVVMGMLLEIALQVIGTVSRWMPQAVYWGKFGMHFWTAVAFGYLFTVLECIRCALAGMYADVPFVCDAAYIQIPYD